MRPYTSTVRYKNGAGLITRSVSAVIVRLTMTVLVITVGMHALPIPTANAITPFARKYAVDCTACHTAPPRLNTFGERFLENGYQLPGTQDGGTTGKKHLGDVSLDDVADYTGVRLRGNVLRSHQFTQQHPSGAEAGTTQNSTDLTFPEVFSLFTAGTLAPNIGFFAELESNLEASRTGIELAFITFNNVGGDNIAHIRVGKIDPSAAFSFSTLRQQLDFIGESIHPSTNAVQRAGLFPLAAQPSFTGYATGQAAPFLPIRLHSITQSRKPALKYAGGPSEIGSCIKSGC